MGLHVRMHVRMLEFCLPGLCAAVGVCVWARMSEESTSTRRIGGLLLAAFHHVAIINLPRSNDRRNAITEVLQGLHLRPGVDFSFPPAVDCADWGQWSEDAVQKTTCNYFIFGNV